MNDIHRHQVIMKLGYACIKELQNELSFAENTDIKNQFLMDALDDVTDSLLFLLKDAKKNTNKINEDENYEC